MIPVHLHTGTGEKLTIYLKEGWQDVTTADYIALQGKPESELLQWLTGLSAEQLAGLSEPAALMVAQTLNAFTALPEGECSVNIEAETVGQFETVKSFLARFYREDAKTARVRSLPYVYGQYMVNSNDKDKSWSNRLSTKLANDIMAMPADGIIPVALKILEQIEKVADKYNQLAHDDDEAGNNEAGENEMERFGFHTALHMLAGGDILKHEAIMQQSVRSVYTHLYFLQQLAKSQKEEVNG